MARRSIAAAVLLLSAAVTAQPPLPQHPRLALTAQRVVQLQAAIASDPDAADFATLLRSHADWVLDKPPIQRGVPDATGVLMHVRAALDFMWSSALAYRLFGNESYLQRAVEEAMNAVLNWSDWNPWQHTLDMGEMSAAVGLTLDWLYQDLNASVRSTLVSGIVEKSLTPFAEGLKNHSFFWVNNSINWNCVCSTGGMTAALAVLGEPGVDNSMVWREVFEPLLESIPTCTASYPGGGWMEGPGYWGYATKYNVLAIAVLESALGSDMGLAELPGVSIAGQFPLQSTGAGASNGTGKVFDWADSHTPQGLYPFSQYFGSRFNDLPAAYFSRLVVRSLGPAGVRSNGTWGSLAEALLYYDAAGNASDLLALSTAKLYDDIAVGSFRSTWAGSVPADEHVLFFKGGNDDWNHAHLDLGTWVYDNSGVRFAEDLGGDSYEIPNYFKPTADARWGIYRCNSHGHNVLTFNGANHSYPAAAGVLAFNHTPGGAPTPVAGLTYSGFAVVDMSAAYLGAKGAPLFGVSRVLRGWLSLANSSVVVVVDEISYTSSTSAATAAPLNLTWSLHTYTHVSLPETNSTHAYLTSGPAVPGSPDVNVTVAILPATAGGACPTAALMATPINLLPPAEPTPGLIRLDATLTSPAAVGCTRLAVALGDSSIVSPGSGLPAGLVLRAVDQWQQYGPFQ